MFKTIQTFFNPKNDSTQKYTVDLHSHLIPAIDDGTKNMQESIELIRSLQDLGFTKLITTPHIMSHRFPNTKAIILSKLEELHAELHKQNIDIIVEASAEYYLDSHLLELIQTKEILVFGKNYLLFETAYNHKPLSFDAILYEMQVAGYTPVLAHPERYLFMHKDLKMYEALKEKGVLFQLNLNSLSGYYSKAVQKVAYQLINKGWIDFLGSDTHKAKHLEHFSKNMQAKTLHKIFEKNRILNHTLM